MSKDKYSDYEIKIVKYMESNPQSIKNLNNTISKIIKVVKDSKKQNK